MMRQSRLALIAHGHARNLRLHDKVVAALAMLAAFGLASCGEAQETQEQVAAPAPTAAQSYISDPEIEAAIAAKARTLEEAADESVRLLAAEYDRPPPEAAASEAEDN
jgi:type IV pilus biogenesis protein CpaD/CtpE